MKQISSRWTFFLKRAFPVMWFGMLAVFLGLSLTPAYGPDNLAFVWVLVGMAPTGFLLMKRLIWILVDEVHDCGDSLLIRNRGEETRVALSEITNVSAQTLMHPPHITLWLRSPSRFGSEIPFLPVAESRRSPFAPNEVAQDLIARVDRARTGRAG